jgi:cytochrome c-type biogenesis protein CcmH
MTVFLILAALMLAAALAFVLTPLLRGARGVDPSVQATRKLKALDNALSEGVLSQSEYEAKRGAMANELLGQLSTPASTQPSRSVRLITLIVAIALPAGALLVYRLVGNPRALDPSALVQKVEPDAEHGMDIEKAIGSLAEKLKANPEDADGWALLGRAYKETERFAEARDALKRAHSLAPDNPDITVEYAEALALSSDAHRLDGESRQLIENALKADPKNQRGLWLLGISNYQQGKFDAAIANWNQLLTLLPPDSDAAASVQKQITQAQQQASEPASTPAPVVAAKPTRATAAAPAAATPAGSGPRLTVQVDLDPKLKAQVPAGAILFIYAKAVSGPPMPLAIQRLRADQLPITVTLDDSMGMLPSMKLSMFPQVIIGARISKSGNAQAQSGDLQVLSAATDVTSTKPIVLKIDQVVP